MGSNFSKFLKSLSVSESERKVLHTFACVSDHTKRLTKTKKKLKLIFDKYEFDRAMKSLSK